MTTDYLFGRRASLAVVAGTNAIDLSELRFRFNIQSDDEESPNNASIRVYNLDPNTARKIQLEYTKVIIQGGYGDNFGVIFSGTIRQYRVGREGNVNTYMDILAADGDMAYNFAVFDPPRSLASGSDPRQRIEAAVAAMAPKGVEVGSLEIPGTGGTLPRGKVLFGMAKTLLRRETQGLGATWSIQNGKVNIIPLTKYLPGEAVVLTSKTGLIGRPEQTQDGIRLTCLLNPKIVVGGLVQIDNASINLTVNPDGTNVSVPYNRWAGLQVLANTSADGKYRVYVIEHEGDTRGQPFYSHLTLLSVDPTTNTCKAYP